MSLDGIETSKNFALVGFRLGYPGVKVMDLRRVPDQHPVPLPNFRSRTLKLLDPCLQQPVHLLHDLTVRLIL